eukprot:s765_g20.t1
MVRTLTPNVETSRWPPKVVPLGLPGEAKAVSMARKKAQQLRWTQLVHVGLLFSARCGITWYHLLLYQVQQLALQLLTVVVGMVVACICLSIIEVVTSRDIDVRVRCSAMAQAPETSESSTIQGDSDPDMATLSHAEALRELQDLVQSRQIPYLGQWYSRIALKKLGVQITTHDRHSDSSAWVDEGRYLIREVHTHDAHDASSDVLERPVSCEG